MKEIKEINAVEKVKILGESWRIAIKEEEEDEYFRRHNYAGYCDYSRRIIVIRALDPEDFEENGMLIHYQRILRHEIVHAFLFESGLGWDSSRPRGGWAMHEEMVDWIAFQGGKLHESWKEAGAI